MRHKALADVTLDEDYTSVRTGRIDIYPLLTGHEGEPGGFELRILDYHSGYSTPRHHHIHEQIRWVFEGKLALAGNKYLEAGELGYWSQGVFYGGESPVFTRTLDLQYGSADGPALTFDQLRAARTALGERGEFHDGVFTYVDGDGRKWNRDAYEANWEFTVGRAAAYPSPPRYREPIAINPRAFGARRSGDGVLVRPLGTFGETLTSIALYAAAQGTELPFGRTDQESLLFLHTGELRAGGESFGGFTAFHLERGEHVVLEVGEPSEVLEIALPRLDGIEMIDQTRTVSEKPVVTADTLGSGTEAAALG